MPGEFSLCETVAAYVWHIRELSAAGKKLGGGADTPALCGAMPSWDLRSQFSEQAKSRCCRTCWEKYMEAEHAR